MSILQKEVRMAKWWWITISHFVQQDGYSLDPKVMQLLI